MTYKQIEASREARLWISQVIVPVVSTAVMIMTIPEARTAVVKKTTDVKDSIKRKFKKK